MEWKVQLRDSLLAKVSPEESRYLQQAEQLVLSDYKSNFNKVYLPLSRKLTSQTKETIISIASSEDHPLIINQWTVLRLARVWMLSLINDEPKEYKSFIDKLFEYADVQELTALYSALNIFRYPELWIERCQIGIRSNIGPVQQAIIEHNKYPAQNLNEDAWNQMVLKAFFTEKDIPYIYGLLARDNDQLQASIVDYIYERDSAQREIHPLLWLLAKDNLPPRAVGILTERLNKSMKADERYISEQVSLQNAQRTMNTEEMVSKSSEELLENYLNLRNVYRTK